MKTGAGEGIRTLDPNLGNVLIFWPSSVSGNAAGRDAVRWATTKRSRTCCRTAMSLMFDFDPRFRSAFPAEPKGLASEYVVDESRPKPGKTGSRRVSSARAPDCSGSWLLQSRWSLHAVLLSRDGLRDLRSKLVGVGAIGGKAFRKGAHELVITHGRDRTRPAGTAWRSDRAPSKRGGNSLRHTIGCPPRRILLHMGVYLGRSHIRMPQDCPGQCERLTCGCRCRAHCMSQRMRRDAR